jgi:hypothetical protein
MIDQVIAYEEGMLSEVDEIKLFSELVKTGAAWSLQGFYGRNAMNLINHGILDRSGNILVDLNEIE